MLLSDLAERLELLTRHALQGVRRSHSGLIAELGTVLPNGEDARISLAWTFSELESAQDNGILIMVRCNQADEALERYATSFFKAPTPKWDDQAWAP